MTSTCSRKMLRASSTGVKTRRKMLRYHLSRPVSFCRTSLVCRPLLTSQQ
ncbi:hypothetical protein NP493_235g03074 [Ridgeia piscesae]|uniref:Uncharacterized protein n=1 Tax=Ridgeia piscesae TaxID=27915 RepID=A0AAD9NZQ3_RIDPI|nr:hypothetical protein NP493_235g03074 [Ridgeia piscesae]